MSLAYSSVAPAIARAIEAGAEAVAPLTTKFNGHRDGRVRDPFGHEWLLAPMVEDVAPEEMQRRWEAMVKKVC